MAAASRLLDRSDSVLVVIDVQEGFRGKVVDHERFIRGVRRLVEAARVLGIPLLVTEQYPKGLGPTQPEVREAFPEGQEIVAKMSMSCYAHPRFADLLHASRRSQAVLCGVEAHACVNQTAHHLMERGYQVHVVRDAISSRFPHDLETAWEKMVASGVVPATVESALLEWIRTAEAPEFKAIQRLIK